MEKLPAGQPRPAACERPGYFCIISPLRLARAGRALPVSEMVLFSKPLSGDKPTVQLPQVGGTLQIGEPVKKTTLPASDSRGQRRAEQSRYQARCRAAMQY